MQKKNIIVYSIPECPYCKMLKDFFAENNIEYQDFDVSKDEARRDEMQKKSHQLGVPVVDADGEVFVGFNRAELSTFFGIEEK